jgi:AraC family transcriptional regulator of arabinose operon
MIQWETLGSFARDRKCPDSYMDYSPRVHYVGMPIQEGFQNQRMAVVPRPIVAEALKRPVTRRLIVTDAGYYPSAADHEMNRPRGADETIIIVCASGTGWARVGDTIHRIGSQSALIIPRSVPHSYGADADNPWSIWWCHLSGTDAAELVESLDVTAARPIVPIRRIERAVALLDEVVSALERDQSPPRLIGTAGAAWRLLTQIILDRATPEQGDPLERAMAYLAERLDGSVRVPELAKLVGVSPSHLTTLFRRATGGGVIAHHSALRMARARVLLDSTTQPVASIADELGFSDPFYFSRQFRRSHGMSPTQFRQRYEP